MQPNLFRAGLNVGLGTGNLIGGLFTGATLFILLGLLCIGAGMVEVYAELNPHSDSK